VAERIQMSRQKPWRVEHPDAVIVARPSKWGNPWRVTKERSRGRAGELFRTTLELRMTMQPELFLELRADLEGRDLACWCPVDQPCHADVLLELANPIPTEAGEGDR